MPAELTLEDIHSCIQAFAATARRAVAAGFEVFEIHAAHGYLINEFLSPLSNTRTDDYGGTFENRTRFGREVIQAVRHELPDEFPLLLRISSTDWVDGGWTLADSVTFSRTAAALGVDLIDCSSGGNSPAQNIQLGPGYQVPFAETIRRETGIPTGAVGMITEAHQADDIIRSGKADMVLLAREMLRDPYWPIHAAQQLGGTAEVPAQYARAFPAKR